jgi:hypothetical protein
MLNCKSITDEIKQDSEANKRGRWIRNRKEFHRRDSEKSQLAGVFRLIRSGQVRSISSQYTFLEEKKKVKSSSKKLWSKQIRLDLKLAERVSCIWKKEKRHDFFVRIREH